MVWICSKGDHSDFLETVPVGTYRTVQVGTVPYRSQRLWDTAKFMYVWIKPPNSKPIFYTYVGGTVPTLPYGTRMHLKWGT